jgi:hypothetical protein
MLSLFKKIKTVAKIEGLSERDTRLNSIGDWVCDIYYYEYKGTKTRIADAYNWSGGGNVHITSADWKVPAELWCKSTHTVSGIINYIQYAVDNREEK